jgi:broad specificity phosphatase PhoE
MVRFIAVLSVFLTGFIFAQETHLLLIRHGTTKWNEEGKAQGQNNIPLSEKGKEQAVFLSEILARDHAELSAIYSSDLDRAYDTALPTARLFSLDIERNPMLNERNKENEEETKEQLLPRIKPAFLSIVCRHLGEKVAIFTHGDVINVFLMDSKNADAYIADHHIIPGSISEFLYEEEEGFTFLRTALVR